MSVQVANAGRLHRKPQEALIAIGLPGPLEDGERGLQDIPPPQQKAIRQPLLRVGELSHSGAVLLNVAPSGALSDGAVHQGQAERMPADGGPDRIKHVRWTRARYIGVDD